MLVLREKSSCSRCGDRCRGNSRSVDISSRKCCQRASHEHTHAEADRCAPPDKGTSHVPDGIFRLWGGGSGSNRGGVSRPCHNWELSLVSSIERDLTRSREACGERKKLRRGQLRIFRHTAIISFLRECQEGYEDNKCALCRAKKWV
jgi:hypothetical protein